jgi:tetratricopeptide (TPR) repeat protein
MKRTYALAFALAAAAAAATLAPGEARAQSAPSSEKQGIEEGRARFNRGIELYKEGNFHAALAEFRAAYAAAPSFRIHYNLGQTLYQLQDYAGAIRSFERYLAEGGEKIEPERRSEVERDLAKLRPRVAKLVFVVNVPDAEVSIDDEARGEITSEPLLVSAGRRRVAVTAAGHQTETRVLDVAGAQELELKFELRPLTSAAPEPVRAPGSPRDDPGPVRRSRTPFYVGLASTVALGAGTAVMAVVTANNHAEYQRALDRPNDAEAIRDARSATRTTAVVADVLGGATVLAAGLTVLAFALTSGSERPTSAAKSARTSPPKPSVRPAFGPNAVGVVGTF